MTSPSPRVWIATFISLVFTIGVLAGVVLDRTWLRQSFGPGGGRAAVRDGMGPGPGGTAAIGRGGGRGPGGGGQLGAGRGAAFGPAPEQYVADLTRVVSLTDAQQTDVLALLKNQEARLRTMQDEARASFILEQNALHDKIAAMLTPEQATAFRSWANRQVGRRGGAMRQ